MDLVINELCRKIQTIVALTHYGAKGLGRWGRYLEGKKSKCYYVCQ